MTALKGFLPRTSLVTVFVALGCGIAAGLELAALTDPGQDPLIRQGTRPAGAHGRKAFQAEARPKHTPNGAAKNAEPVAAAAARIRRTYEAELESRIEADARLMVREKIFSGPILGVTCTPRSIQRPRVAVINLNCLAIKRRVTTALGPALEGARYFATLDLSSGSGTYAGD